jgi:hypothetical protein
MKMAKMIKAKKNLRLSYKEKLWKIENDLPIREFIFRKNAKNLFLKLKINVNVTKRKEEEKIKAYLHC